MAESAARLPSLTRRVCPPVPLLPPGPRACIHTVRQVPAWDSQSSTQPPSTQLPTARRRQPPLAAAAVSFASPIAEEGPAASSPEPNGDTGWTGNNLDSLPVWDAPPSEAAPSDDSGGYGSSSDADLPCYPGEQGQAWIDGPTAAAAGHRTSVGSPVVHLLRWVLLARAPYCAPGRAWHCGCTCFRIPEYRLAR